MHDRMLVIDVVKQQVKEVATEVITGRAVQRHGRAGAFKNEMGV
jgi:hypothetical protein